MSKKKLSFRQFDIENVAELLPLLERCLRESQIDFYLLGGLARDINLMREGISPHRITKDVDIAVFVPNANQFSELKTRLIDQAGFIAAIENPLAVYYKNIKVDILPFNHLISTLGETKALGPAFSNFNLQGLHEVYLHSTDEIELELSHRFRFSTMEAIILLKLLAYEDRPEQRLKDLEDIAELIRYFFPLNDEEIFQQHNDLFGSQPDLDEIACRVIGRKIGATIKENAALASRILTALQKHWKEGINGPLLLNIIKNTQKKKSIAEAKRLIQQMITGVEEGIAS